jgi:hypothetical protein
LVEVAFTEVVAVFAAALVEEGSGVEASRAAAAGVGAVGGLVPGDGADRLTEPRALA